jgi:NADPH:quinone reductase-like Zn-dependent oxidoreductase
MFSKILKNTLERIVLFNVTATFVLSAGSVYGESYQQIVINEYGPPNVMQLVEQEMLPEPAAGEVRIKVLAAGASFTDTMVRKGVYVGVDAEFSFSPRYDLVGIVDKLGAGVEGFNVGQKVADLTVYGATPLYRTNHTYRLTGIVRTGAAEVFAVASAIVVVHRLPINLK